MPDESDGDKIQVEILQRMSSAERIKIGCELYDFTWEMLAAQIRQDNPGYSEQEVFAAVRVRFNQLEQADI